jgi:hypothetical protein
MTGTRLVIALATAVGRGWLRGGRGESPRSVGDLSGAGDRRIQVATTRSTVKSRVLTRSRPVASPMAS